MGTTKNRTSIPEDNRGEKEPARENDAGPAKGESPGGEAGPEGPGRPGPEGSQSPASAGDTAARERLLEEARAEAERFKDQLLRKAAEFENYKRRSESDWQTMQRLAGEKILLAFLPILDDLLRSLKSGAEQKSFDAFYQGVELIYQKMLKTFRAQGVDSMEAAGKPFSVEEHDALLQIPREDVPPHTVLEEVEKGYRLGDRVLRHAKVIVSAEAPAPGTDPSRPGGRNEAGKQGGKHDAA